MFHRILLVLSGLIHACKGAGNLGIIPTEPCTHHFCDNLPAQVVDESLNGLEQDDPKLIAFIRDNLIGDYPTEPFAMPKETFRVDQNDGYPEFEGQMGQPTVIEK